MAGNRRRQPAGARLAPAVKAAVAVLLVGGAAVGYVWQKEQIGRLGREIKDREARLSELRESNLKLRKQLATVRSPQMIERKLRSLQMNLSQPRPEQVLRLVEVPAATPPPSTTVIVDGRPTTGPGSGR